MIDKIMQKTMPGFIGRATMAHFVTYVVFLVRLMAAEKLNTRAYPCACKLMVMGRWCKQTDELFGMLPKAHEHLPGTSKKS